MSSRDSRQDWASVYKSSYVGYYGCFARSFLVVCLTGLPFIGVFFTKHCFFRGCIFSFGFFFVALLYLGFVLTLVYSFRFVFMLWGDSFGLVLCLFQRFYVIFYVIFLRSLLNVLIRGLLEEVYVASRFRRLMLLLCQFLGFFIGWAIYNFTSSVLTRGNGESLAGCKTFVERVYSLYNRIQWFTKLANFRWEAFLVSVFRGKKWGHVLKFYRGSAGVGWIVFGICCIFVVYGVLG